MRRQVGRQPGRNNLGQFGRIGAGPFVSGVSLSVYARPSRAAARFGAEPVVSVVATGAPVDTRSQLEDVGVGGGVGGDGYPGPPLSRQGR